MVIETFKFKDKTFKADPDVYMPDFQRGMFNEEDEDRQNWWNIQPKNVVVDVGAGTGSWTLPAAVMGATVYAFECDPHRIHALKENVKCNPEMNVITEDRGLYSRDCELGMDMNSSSVMLQLGYQPQTRVKMTTLDGYWRDNCEAGFGLGLDWLKIDVEGAELHVISGAINTITKYKPKIIVECHTFIIPGIDGMVLSYINRLECFYKCTSVLRRSAPGAIDLRSYTYPRLLFEPTDN